MQFCRSAAISQTRDCIEWPFAKTAAGYGVISDKKKLLYAHRIVCCLAHGDPPDLSAQVAHSCRNPGCITPAHLRWATPAQNIADKWQHGTMLRGEQIRNSVLSAQQVEEIRSLYRAGKTTQRELGRKFGVRQQQISRICRYEHWNPDPLNNDTPEPIRGIGWKKSHSIKRTETKSPKRVGRRR